MLPSTGFQAVNSAKLNAVKNAITPAKTIETKSAEPAKSATMPKTTKMPEPMVDPRLMAVALHKPSLGFRAACFRCSSMAFTTCKTLHERSYLKDKLAKQNYLCFSLSSQNSRVRKY